MAMNKIERIDREIAKTREKITECQNKLRRIEAQNMWCLLSERMVIASIPSILISSTPVR